MCLAISQWLVRKALSPRGKQRGIRCHYLFRLLGAPGPGPAPGERQPFPAFVDPTSAIDRVRTAALGPGQRLAIAAMEVCDQVLAQTTR